MKGMEYFGALGIALGVVGAILLAVSEKRSSSWRLGLALFGGGAFAIVWSFLLLNPDWRQTFVDNAAIMLIGLVIATISIIKMIVRQDG